MLVDVEHAQSMTRFLYRVGVPIFEYPDWANQFHEELRSHAEALAREHGLEIEVVHRDGRYRP